MGTKEMQSFRIQLGRWVCSFLCKEYYNVGTLWKFNDYLIWRWLLTWILWYEGKKCWEMGEGVVSTRGRIVCTHGLSKSRVSSRAVKSSLLQGAKGNKLGQIFFFFEVLKSNGEEFMLCCGRWQKVTVASWGEQNKNDFLRVLSLTIICNMYGDEEKHWWGKQKALLTIPELGAKGKGGKGTRPGGVLCRGSNHWVSNWLGFKKQWESRMAPKLLQYQNKGRFGEPIKKRVFQILQIESGEDAAFQNEEKLPLPRRGEAGEAKVIGRVLEKSSYCGWIIYRNFTERKIPSKYKISCK